MMHPRALFEEKVEDGPGCWIWRGPMATSGYGKFAWDGRREYAHRIAWTLVHEEPIPAGLVIRHTCDNPKCVRPDHLLIGTKADNSRDMVVRGRSQRKPYCKRGHRRPDSPERRPDCPECARVRAREQRARLRAA